MLNPLSLNSKEFRGKSDIRFAYDHVESIRKRGVRLFRYFLGDHLVAEINNGRFSRP